MERVLDKERERERVETEEERVVKREDEAGR